jgi:hypothetical protein
VFWHWDYRPHVKKGKVPRGLRMRREEAQAVQTNA